MPVGINSGGFNTFTLLAGETLTVSAESGATGRVVVLNALLVQMGAVDGIESAEDVSDGVTAVKGPYPFDRTIRVYSSKGTIHVGTSVALPAITKLVGPSIVGDGKTIQGSGAKPNTNVLLYNKDSGRQLGIVPVDVDGDWMLIMSSYLPAGTRIGYDIVVSGPYLVVGDNTTYGLDLTMPIDSTGTPVG